MQAMQLVNNVTELYPLRSALSVNYVYVPCTVTAQALGVVSLF